MLYPSNIKVEGSLKKIKEKLKSAGSKVKEKVAYLILDRKNFFKRIIKDTIHLQDSVLNGYICFAQSNTNYEQKFTFFVQ